MMSKEEILMLASLDEHQLIDNLLLLNELVDYKRLAYTKKVYCLLFTTTKDNLIEDMKQFDFNKDFEKSFKLNLQNNQDFEVEFLADIIWNKLDNPKVDVNNPTTIFEIIFHDKTYVCKLVYEQDENFEERKPHFRPFNHPTGLHPRLARFMVNLSNAESIVDPFCGAGGILIEAGLTGIVFQGYDIDPIMVERCKGNLRHYNLDLNVQVKDALKLDQPVEAIVTDLPYGKNSKATELNKLYKDFFKKTYFLTDKIVVALPDFINHKSIFCDWKIKKNFHFYLHKSLSKKIFLLLKD